MGFSQHRHTKTLFTEEEETALFTEYQTTENPVQKKRLFNKIVMNYTPLVYKIQRRFAGYNLDQDDLISEGNLGLTEAANRFVVGNGNRFAAYAISWISGVMMSFITRNFAIVNYCTDGTKKSLFFQLRRIISAEQKRTNNFEVTPALLDSIAYRLGVPLKEIQAILSMFQTRYEGLDQPVRGGSETGDSTRLDMLKDERQDQESSLIDKERITFHRELIMTGMDAAKLSPRERMIIEAQYLADSKDRLTLEELGNTLEVSKERVRQIRNKAYARLTRGVKRTARSKYTLDDMFAV